MIIGITGWFASGKDTVADYLKEKGFKSVSLSDIIREHLRADGLEITRGNLLMKGNELRTKFGNGYLAEQALKKVEEEGAGNWVVPAVRQTGEVEALKKSKNFQLWEIFAPVETRFERMQARDKGGEDDAIKTVEDLKKKENLENAGANNSGPQIGLVITAADKRIDNSGTFPELYKQVDDLIG